MPTTRYVIRRPSRAKLTHSQELELWLGPSHHGTTFASDEHRRAAWFRHRDRLMRWWGRDGRRPMGWWLYEAPEKGLRFPGSKAHERSILYEAGVLSEEECAKLEQWWREEFDKTWVAGFSYFKEGRIFTGEIARELHWVWADLPPVLHEKWMAERQRRSQAIRKLEEEGPPEQGEAAAEG